MNNRYAPLLKLKHELGILSEYERSLIKTRTSYSWNNIDPNELVGYNPNDPLVCDKAVFSFTHSHKHVRTLLKLYMSLFTCFRTLAQSVPNLNAKLRKQKTVFIDAYNYCKKYISAEKFKRLTGVSPQKINRWQNEIYCGNSVLEKCVLENPHQLTFEEQNIIARELQNPVNDHLFKCDLWAKLLRNGILKCKLTTFYKYSRFISQKPGLIKEKIKLPVSHIIAKAPLTVLHMDCTIVRTLDGGKWYINVIFDNFSKAILGICAMETPNSYDVMINLKNVVHEYGLQDKKFSLYCDGGPENRGFMDV
ncbi:MAG TPA: hypothetical protein VD905_00900, partial [Flavobacteriales bacterium]|nr:hypothetical protein [Flavobacteriales bacterium]